jgi:hypothetical protein
MPTAGTYGESLGVGAKRARTEEEVMNPYMSQYLAAEHIRDLRRQAAAARRSRRPRRARRGAIAVPPPGI